MKSVTFCKGFLLSLSLSLSNKSCTLKNNSKNFKLAFAILFLGLFFGFSGKASAATYCVKASGTATEVNSAVANSTACTNATNSGAMSMATFNAGTFSGGDTVYFTTLGGIFTTGITTPSSGTSTSNLINYQGIADGARGTYPIITVASGFSIYTHYKSFINVSGFDVEYGGTTAGDIHVYILGVASDVTLSNLIINGHGYGWGIDGGANLSNITLNNITISNLGAYASLNFSGTTNSNIIISNFITSSGRGMSITNTNNLTLTNVTSNTTISSSYYPLDIENNTGNASIINYHSTGAPFYSLYLNNNTFDTLLITSPVITSAGRGLYIGAVSASTSINISYPTISNTSGAAAGITLVNVASPSIQLLNGAIYGNGSGITIDQVPGIVIKGFNPLNITNGGIHDNNASGGSGSGITMLATSGNSNNAIIEDNWIYNNGYPYSTGGNANHDGIDIHANCNNETIANNLIIQNGNSGMAFVFNSSGQIYNNTIAYNGTSAGTSTIRGGYYNSGTGVWTLKNNIFYQNYPTEENVTNVTPTSNYNLFYHTADSNVFRNNSTSTNYTFTAWQALGHDAQGINTDPLFVNLPIDFSLQSTSPAINAGTDVGLTTDYAGNPKSGANWDIGAYEFQDSTAPTTTANINTGTYNATQNVTLTCSDGAGVGCDKTYYTLDNSTPTTGSFVYATSLNISTTTTLKFFSQDKSLNSETYQTKIYTIDTTAPTGGAFTINSGVTHTNSTSATLNITCPTDPWATVQMAYGDSASSTNWKNCATSEAWTLPTGDGDKTVYVRFKDGGNNTTSDLTQTINLDQTVPTVTDITSTTTDGSYKVGSIINVRITFSENVTISGSPRIKLQTNNGNKYATYSAGTGTQNIDFIYTVQAGDTTSDLDYVDTASLELNNGTIKDGVNNNATLTLPALGVAHSLSNNKNIILDTTAPTISDLAPNNTTFSVTTTSTNLTLTTTETATCKYSTTSGTDYASMTAFDTTNNTSHSTFISSLNIGTIYNYYIKCQDVATNESSESSLTFSVAPTENNSISLENIKIKVGREINKFKDTIHIAKNKLKLKQEDTNLANGTVKIYKDNKRIDTIDINSDGSWDKILKLKDEFSGWIKIRQYDQFGTLLSTDKAKIKVDTEDPKFNEAIPEKMTIGRNQKISFTATDDNSGIDYYKVKLADVRDWRQQNEDFYQIPENVPNGAYDLFIRAYDKTGNYAEEKTTLAVSRFKKSVDLASASLNPQNNQETNKQNTESQIQSHTDKNTDTTPNNSSSSNSPSPQPQSQPSTSHWWNPFSWF